MSLRIAGYESCSTIDWYGKLATVFFCTGCNFSCRYCHNYNLINPSEGDEVTIKYIADILDMNDTITEAVVFTGGEPTLQESLYDVCKYIKEELEYPIMIDTNGSNVDLLYRLMRDELIDRIALDVKASLNPISYESIIGVPAESYVSSLLVTLKWAKHYGVEVEARTTVLPTITDEIVIDNICHRLRYYIDDYYLQQCDLTDPLDPEISSLPYWDRNDLMFLAAIARMAGIESVYIKTREHGIEKIY